MVDKKFYLDDVLDEANIERLYTHLGRSREDKITLYESIGILATDYPDLSKSLAELYVWRSMGANDKKLD